MPCDNCRRWDEACSWPTGGRGKACHTCKKRWVSCQVNGEPLVSGEPRLKKNNGSPMRKKRKVSCEVIVESGLEVEEEVVQPEARLPSEEVTGSVRALSEAIEGSGVTRALWSIAMDLQAIRRCQEAMASSIKVGCQVAQAQVVASQHMAHELSSTAYDLESLANSRRFLRTHKMGLVEGEVEVEPSEEEKRMQIRPFRIK